MPTYTYECKSCNHRFEEVLRIAHRYDPCTKPCPECGADEVKMMIVANFELLAPDQLGRVKPPEDWRDFLKTLKRKNPGSDFNTF